MRGLVAWALLLAITALAFAVRGAGFEWVFVGDAVVFAPADAMYHARRALYTFANFPAVLVADLYINHPEGAPVPWPPGFDFALGAAARLVASDERGFEVAVAWAGPLLGALTAIPVYAMGSRVASRGVGLVAALLFALLPIHVAYTRVGNPDHHAAVALIGAWLLALCLALVDVDWRHRTKVQAVWLSVWLSSWLAVARILLLLTWHGSLLYLVPVEATLLLAGALLGRERLYLVQSASAAAALAVVVPVLLALPEPLGGAFSSIALSWLHVLVLGAAALVALGAFALERARPAGSAAVRLARMCGVAAALGVLFLLLPGPREGLLPAFGFLTLGDAAGMRTGEQSPLFALSGRTPVRSALLTWGVFAYAIPLAPVGALALLWRDRRSLGFTLAAWTALFTALALTQRRYGNDLAPVASVVFALALVRVGTSAARRIGLRAGFRRAFAVAFAGLVSLALLAPPIQRILLPRVASSLMSLGGAGPPPAMTHATPAGVLVSFARAVRRATPETSGFLGGDRAPEYGIAAHPNYGHALQYVARRPTPADPFWEYIGPASWDATFALFASRSEEEAVALARELRVRYVVTTPSAPGTVADRLHRSDGAGEHGQGTLGRFRLVLEARPGSALVGSSGPRGDRTAPYKLFEVVQGAELAIEAPPDSVASAEVVVATGRGRRFVWRAIGLARAGGVTLRVPYATDSAGPTRTVGPYLVRFAGEERRVDVPEAAVQEGLRVPVR